MHMHVHVLRLVPVFLFLISLSVGVHLSLLLLHVCTLHTVPTYLPDDVSYLGFILKTSNSLKTNF